MEFHPQEGSFRTLAKALLGAFLFLLVASFLALPCMTTGSGMFSSVAGPQACQEHKLFKAQADLAKLKLLPAETFFRSSALPAAFIVFTLAALLSVAALTRPSGGRIRARAGTMPFATADPPKIPAFAALRDA